MKLTTLPYWVFACSLRVLTLSPASHVHTCINQMIAVDKPLRRPATTVRRLLPKAPEGRLSTLGACRVVELEDLRARVLESHGLRGQTGHAVGVVRDSDVRPQRAGRGAGDGVDEVCVGAVADARRAHGVGGADGDTAGF